MPRKITAEGQVPQERTVILTEVLPRETERSGRAGRGGHSRWLAGAHLGSAGRPSSPTVAQCSPTWQPRAPRRQRGGFLLLGGPRPPQAEIPSSQEFRPSPWALTTKSALFFGGLSLQT